MLGRIQSSSAPIANSAIDLVIFDRAIADRSTLLNGLQAGAIGVTLACGDPIAEIGQWLQHYAPVRSLHLVSHGRPGGLQLGDRWIEAADLQPTNVGTWREWLTAGATISLYGCEVARDHLGLPERLARLTGASVAASRGLVGATAAGGNWLLEAVVGTARSVLPWSSSQLAAYPGVLAVIPVGSQMSFQSALDTMSSNDIISLTNDINITTPLILKASTTTIYGNGYAIDGGNTTRLMHHQGTGSLAAYDLTFRNARSGGSNAYYTAFNTNGLDFAGSKITFTGNTSVAELATVGSHYVAIGAAIYGGGKVQLADSAFTNNTVTLDGLLRNQIQGGLIDPTNPSELSTSGAAIYAIGSPVSLLDTQFANNYITTYIPNSFGGWDVLDEVATGDQLIDGTVYAENVTGLGSKAIAGSVSRPQLSVASGSNVKEGSSSPVVFQLDAPLPYPLEFNYTIDGVSTTAVFPHSTSTYTPSFAIADDTIYNPGRTIAASVDGGNVYQIGTGNILVSVTDDEPLVRFTSTTANLTEGGSGISLNLSLDKPAPRNFAIAYSVTGTARGNEDFSALSGNVSISQGATSATIPISSLDDETLESDETIIVTLSPTTTNYGVSTSAKTATVTLKDNEIAPVTNLTLVQSPKESGPTSAKFTINLATPALQGDTQGGVLGTLFYYTVSNGTATQGIDYAAMTGQVFIPKGQSSATIDIPIYDDLVYESGGETFFVQLNNHPAGLYVPGANNKLTMTIADDEVIPVATVNQLGKPVEVGQVPGQLQVNLSSIALSGGVTVAYEVVSGSTATSNNDYKPLTGRVTIPERQTQGLVTVTPVDDIAYDPNEKLILRLIGSSGQLYTVGSNNTATFTFEDNEVIPVASMKKLNDPIEAGQVAGKFEVNLSSIALEGGVTIDYEVVSGSTATSRDYTTMSGSVTIPAGQVQGIVSISPIDDIAFDPDEQLTLRLKPRVGQLYTVDPTDNQATFTFVDNETIPVATLQKLSDPTEASEVPGEFKVNLGSIALEGGVTIGYDVLSSSTIGTSDYTALSGSVTIPENTTQKTIQVIPHDDGLFDPAETLVLKLRDPGSQLYTVGSSDTITLTVIDDEHLYTVRLTPEADAGENGSIGYFLLELDKPALDSGLTINYTLSGGTAIADTDYMGLSGSVTVAPGATQARIRIEAINNAIDAPPRNLELSLSPAAPNQVIEPYRNYTADGSAETATITIADNDTAGVRLTALGNTTNETGTTAEVEIRLESQPTDPVTINFASSDSSEGQLVTTSSVSFNPSDWKTAKTVTVQGIDDGAIKDGDKSYRLTPSVSSSDPAYSSLTLADLTFTNLDDDGYSLLVSTPNRTPEGSTSSYTLALTKPPSAAIPIEILADDQVEVSLDGTTFAPSVITNRTDTSSQTIFVRSLDDSEVEGLHTSTITHRFLDHTDPNYPTGIATTPAIVTIDDNDSPIVGLIKAETATEESVVAGRFGIVLDQNAPAGGVTVVYQVTTQTATSSTDYTSFTGSLFIPEGETGDDIIVNPVQDSLVEKGGETITVALLGGVGYSLDGANTSKTVSIFDDDIAGVRLRESGNASRIRENIAGDSYTLELTSQPSDPVTITLNTSGSVTPSVTSVRFDANNWNKPQTVLLPLENNNIAEGDRSQLIRHSVQSADPQYNGMAVNNVNIAIVDDDIPGMVMSETGFSTRVTEGLVLDSYTLVLESQPIAPVTVTVKQASDSGLEPIAPLVFNASNWNVPQTVTVALVNDFVDRDDRATTLTHTVTSTDSAYNGWVLEDIDVAITEDDNAGMTLTESGDTTQVTENGFNDSYVIALTSQPVAPVTVAVAINSTSKLKPIAPLVFQPSQWNVPQTVNVTLTNDNIDDDDRSATYTQTVTSNDPKYNAWKLIDVVVPITEDDIAGVALVQSGGTTKVAENAFNDSYTITLTSEPIAPVTIDVAIDSTSKLDPVAPLVFQPSQWNVPQTVNVTLTGDDIDNDDRSAIYNHAITSNDPKYDPWFEALPVSITEDDFVGLSIQGTGSRNYVIEGSDNPDFLEIRLNSQPTAPVTIAFNTGTELEPIPTLVIRPEDWKTVFQIPFFATQDTLFEATQSVNLGFTITSADPKYNPTSRLPDTIPTPPSLVVQVADRQLLGSETAAGLGVIIDRFATMFETNLRQQTLPTLTGAIGDLVDLSSAKQELVVPDLFLFKDKLLADLAALGATDATTAAATMTAAIRDSFAKAGINAELTVTPGVNLEELTFDIGIRYSNPFETKLIPNLGLNELKFDLDGTLKGKFDAQLNFALGWNERFGFFVDSQKTKLDTHFNVAPPSGFTAVGAAGLLGGKATDDPKNPTKIDLDYDLSLVDLDDVDQIRFLDVNGNRTWDAIEPLVEEANGSFPTLPIFGRFDTNHNGAYDVNEGTILVTSKPDDSVRLTLTEILENATHPNLANGKFSGIHNLGLNIDTSLPGLQDAPLPRFLFTLDSDWEPLIYDSETDVLISVSQEPSVNFQNFGMDVSSITGFILPIFDIVTPLLKPLDLLLNVLDLDIVPGSIGKLFSTFDIGSIAGIDVDPFNLENFLKGISDVDINIGDFVAGLGDFGSLPSLVANLPTGFVNFGSFGISGPDLPELNLNLPSFTLPRLPSIDLDLGSLGLPAAPGNFDISKFNHSKSIKFPILTDPMQALYLVLGKEDVTLATLETPSLTGSGSINASTGIFQSFLRFIPDWVQKLFSSVGSFGADLSANFGVHAGLGFGFDTQGLYDWSDTGFDVNQVDRVLNGFFVSDRSNPNGTGPDIDELSLALAVNLGFSAGSLLSIAGKGRLSGNLNLNLADPNGDGKVRFYSEILPQLPYINRIIHGGGSITAAGSAKLEFKLNYPSIPDFWNLKTWSTTLYDLKLPQTTLVDLSISDRGISFGTAFDGPMQGSDVFFDANFNGINDPLEPSTITFDGGSYNLEIPLDLFDRNGDGKLDLTEGQIVVEKGTDTDTFQPQRFPFLTAPEWTIASPLTALALRLAQPNLAATEVTLERAFALPSGFDLQADDPFIAIENGNPDGVTVLVAQGQLQNLLILGANALQAPDKRNEAANAIMAQVSERVQSGTALNLTDPAQVQAILDRAAQAIGASADLNEIVAEIQRRNQAIVEASSKPINEVRAAITDNVALEAIDQSYFILAVEPWAVLLRTSQPVPPLDASSRRVIDLLDLPYVDLGTFDPFANLGMYQGVEILTRQIQLNATLTQIADIAIGDGVENAETKAFDAIVAALQSGVQLDDLSNPEIVLSLLKSVASPRAAQQMAEIIAASNANFTTIATTAIQANAFEDVRDQLVEAQIIVQYLQSQLLKAIAAGEISINQFDLLMKFNQTDPNMKTVIQNMIDGTDGNDTLVGTPLNDWIAGRGGDDLLQGLAGDDQLYGNAGVDHLEGDAGNDYLFGGVDNDQLNGGEGDDLLDGGEGDDLLDGADGDDNLIGGAGVDSLIGNLGNDGLSGGEGNDQLDGGENNDYLFGDAGDDAIDGGLGDDFAIGGDGRDSLDGGDGDDSLIGFADPDLLRGGAGNDLLFGNKGRDTLDGGEGDDSLSAGQKDDIVTGGVGNDYLFGNKDNDTIDGGDGDDLLYGGNQNDQLIGGEGNDTLCGDLGEDILIGQAGADVFQLRPSSGVDIIADFITGEDALELVGFAAEITFADLVFSPFNGNTQLTINGEMVAIFNGAVSPTIEDIRGLSTGSKI